ncbi:MAG: hypothetical protein HC883_03170 [Bdellovibrionaceae bacterium]|nr:hypothetical protein [Pseudobdellovibrionaceae bacterium]
MKTLIFLITLISTTQTLSAAEVDCRQADWSGMVVWAKAFYAKNGTTLAGRTTQGMPCELNIWPRDEEVFYISLGTSTNGGTGSGDMNYIGTFINPDSTLSGICTVKQIEITPQTAHIHVIQDEVGAPGVVEHDLFIRSDSNGNVTQAQGSSSYWPSSTCLLN